MMPIEKLSQARNLIDEVIATLNQQEPVPTPEPAPEPAPVPEPEPMPDDCLTQTGFLSNQWLKAARPGDYMLPQTFYFLADQIKSDKRFGRHADDETKNLLNVSIKFPWTGKGVDIVNFESDNEELLTSEINNHPDIGDRFVLMDWPNQYITTPHNTQIKSGQGLEPHTLGCLSVGSGAHCGFAKNAILRAAYGKGSSMWPYVISSITRWHRTKGNDRPTIIQAPTSLRSAYKWAVRIDDISYFETWDRKRILKPMGGWSDFRVFTDNYLIPRRLKDPRTGQWHWVISCPEQTDLGLYKNQIKDAIQQGIHFVGSAGNTGDVCAKDSDPRSLHTRIAVSPHSDHYMVNYSGGKFSIMNSRNYTGSNQLRPLIAQDHDGVDDAIIVGNFQSSETHPLLDRTSSRGPSVDICSSGYGTWSAYPSREHADGWMWGQFGGTSGGAGITAGILACLLEKVHTETGEWLNPQDAKALLIENSKKNFIVGESEVDWRNPPRAENAAICSRLVSSSSDLLSIQNNYTYRTYMSGLAGAPSRLIQYVA